MFLLLLFKNYSTGRHSCKEDVSRFIDSWNDDMKLQLLTHYIQDAENLQERDTKTKKYSRKKTTKNLKPICQKASIIVNGKSVRLDTFDLDTMSKKLAFEGLSGQPSGEGLLDLIDVWNDKTGLDIKENVDDFITSVRNDCCKQ